MKRALDHIVCLPMFNSYGLVDRLLTGNGRSARSFVRVSELASAFVACDIDLDLLREQLQQLELGISIEVFVSQPQMHAFYEGSGSNFNHGSVN